MKLHELRHLECAILHKSILTSKMMTPGVKSCFLCFSYCSYFRCFGGRSQCNPGRFQTDLFLKDLLSFSSRTYNGHCKNAAAIYLWKAKSSLIIKKEKLISFSHVSVIATKRCWSTKWPSFGSQLRTRKSFVTASNPSDKNK